MGGSIAVLVHGSTVHITAINANDARIMKTSNPSYQQLTRLNLRRILVQTSGKLRTNLEAQCDGQCSRIRIFRFFQISKKHDFLRFFEMTLKKT